MASKVQLLLFLLGKSDYTSYYTVDLDSRSREEKRDSFANRFGSHKTSQRVRSISGCFSTQTYCLLAPDLFHSQEITSVAALRLKTLREFPLFFIVS